MTIKQYLTTRDQLVQEIEVTDVAREYGTSELTGLKIQQGVVEELAFVSLVPGQFTQAKQHPRQDAGHSPDIILRGLQSVRRDILSDCFPKLSESCFGFGVSRIEAAKGVG